MPTTSVKLANRIARHLGLDDEGKQRLHRAFRNMITREIVPGTVDPDDARGTILLDDSAAATAVLLLPFADMAVDARGLRDVVVALTRRDHLSGSTKTPIDRALTAVRAGKTVRLIMELRWINSAAAVQRSIRVVIDGEGEDAKAAHIVQNWRDDATEELGRIEVPATTWLRMYLTDAA